MAHSEMAVAGVPSERLSMLAFPQLAGRHRREHLFPEPSASTDGMNAVLRPVANFDKSQKCTSFSYSMDALGYAGKPTCRINSSIYDHGIKKQSAEANKSKQMTALFSNDGQQPKYIHHGARRMKQYCTPDRLSDAFCTKFHVTDPLTGRTEIMTARKPGKATTEINVSEFDGCMLPRERTYSIKKAQDNIDQNILGLMPKPNKEAKFLAGTTFRQVQAPTLECKENWMTPNGNAKVCKPLGLWRRRDVFPWTSAPTDNIAHIHREPETTSPRLSRAYIRPAFVES
ncbi:hypothetical protein Esti_001105 [Eimeria stiedai]